jgi:hypothetical protein
MVINFAIPDTDVVDIPDRLRSRGWIASAVRFTQRVLNNVITLVKSRRQPPPPQLNPSSGLSDWVNGPDCAFDCTTALTPTNPDWHLFFSISPPLTLRGTHHG